MDELHEALRTYQESLAELEAVRKSGDGIADSQEVYWPLLPV